MSSIRTLLRRAAVHTKLAVSAGADDVLRKRGIVADPTVCWWCVSAPAETAEHRYPRAVFGMIHGSGGYDAGQRPLLVVSGRRPYELKSDNVKAIKYDRSLCGNCNNSRSQPYDYALRRFSQYIYASGSSVLDMKSLDFKQIYGDRYSVEVDGLIRAFAKDMGCMIRETGRFAPHLIRHILSHGPNAKVFQVAFFKHSVPFDNWMGKSSFIGGFGPTVYSYRYAYEIGHIRVMLGLRMHDEFAGLELVHPNKPAATLHSDDLLPFEDVRVR